jgi:C-terminal processing protease CtpA/Prc
MKKGYRVNSQLAATRKRLAANLALEKSCEIEQDIELTLSGRDAVRLLFPGNPHRVEEALIGRLDWEGAEVLAILVVLGGGRVSGGVTHLARMTTVCRQVANSVCLMTASWRLKDDRIDLTFGITANVERNRELLRGLQGRDDVHWEPGDLGLLIGSETCLTEAERVEGFVRLWSEVKYNFAFFDRVPEVDWEDVLGECLPAVKREQRNHEYFALLQRCLARLRDGHTGIIGNWRSYEVGRPAVRISKVEGRAIVVAAGNKSDSDSAEGPVLAPGAEIVCVDGRPVSDILETDLYPYISASTPQRRDYEAYAQLFDGPRGSEAFVGVLDEAGKEHVVTVARNMSPSAAHATGFMELHELPGEISYVAINTFEPDCVASSFKQALESIRDSRGLILDVRRNGGGNTRHGYAVIACLINAPLPASVWKTPLHLAVFAALGRRHGWYEGPPERVLPAEDVEPYLGPMAVLIGPGTFSAAEDFLVPLHVSGRAVLVGGPTGGSTGQPLLLNLPGGVQARICAKRDTYPDGRQFVGIGVLPDVEARMTIEDVRRGRDAALEAGIEVLEGLISRDASQ